MDRSRGFGSTACYYVALFRLAFAPPPFQKNLSLQYAVTRRSIMQKVRRQPFISEDMHRPTTACRFMISGSISLPSPGFFSTFPHGTRSLSVRLEYLALAHGRARFLRDFPCPAVLGIPLELFQISNTGLSPSMVCLSRHFFYSSKSHVKVPQPLVARQQGLGCSLFARRYWGNPLRFLLLRLLRCFNSPRFASYAYVFSVRHPDMTQDGLPHSEIFGSKPVCGSPKHIAAYHVLHRLSLPSHPS